MKPGSRRAFLGAAAVAVVCLAGAATVAVRAQTDATPMTDTTFKNILLLKGIPVDTFLDAMGMFANAMGNDCTYCHAPTAALDRNAFATATPRIQRARQMIVMMNAINKQYFAGQPRVTCFTCHGGNQSPRSDPNIALQYSTPPEDPERAGFPHGSDGSADQIFDRYLQASGRRGAAGRPHELHRQGHVRRVRHGSSRRFPWTSSRRRQTDMPRPCTCPRETA